MQWEKTVSDTEKGGKWLGLAPVKDGDSKLLQNIGAYPSNYSVTSPQKTVILQH